MSMTYDLAVIGGGPAGLSAAVTAAQLGVKTVLFDENARPGGQLFKQIHKFFGSSDHQAGTRGFRIGEKLLEEAQVCGIDTYLNTTVVGIFRGQPFRLLAVRDGIRSMEVEAKTVIIAAGASENPLAFPGWTLPGVMSAGAAQTMVNIHRTRPGKRVLMVGTGNVGLIVSYQLLQAGVDVVALVEAAPQVGGYGVHAAKLSRAGVPILCSHTILEAAGTDCVERVRIAPVDSRFRADESKAFWVEADTVCLAVGLNPMTELCRQVGCDMHFIGPLGGYIPLHDRRMETSIPGLFVAGDVAGVEEASTAMEEGRLAGAGAAIRLGINPDAAHRRMEDTWQVVNTLRSGAFGEKRARAKAEILEVGRDRFVHP